jgi:uncharacterized membrane protein
VYAVATLPSTASFVRNSTNITPFLGDITRFSHYLNIIGLITAVPAVATGAFELFGMIKRQDLANKLQKSQDKTATVQKMHPKMKIAFLHAGLNDLAVFGSAYNWWTRSTAAGYAPTDANVLLGVVALTAISFSGYLGGVLVYEYGVGVTTTSEGKRIKEGGKSE